MIASSNERRCWEACERANGQSGSASGSIMRLYERGLQPEDLTPVIVATQMLWDGRLTAEQFRTVASAAHHGAERG